MSTYLWIIPFLSIVLKIKNPGCYGYPTGAPESSCSTLTPRHQNFLPQESSPPYRVQAFERDGKVHVSISQSPEFKGFVIQARSRNDLNRVVHGTFSTEDDVSRAIDCLNGPKNTLTHVNTRAKRGIETRWTPAPGTNEDVVFRATVAETYDKFWTDIDSPVVRVRRGNSEESEPDSGGIDYSSCFVSKGCFGMPNDCINRKDCEILVSFTHGGDEMVFTLEGGISSENSYIATGISVDDKMGDDSVTECFLENGRLSVQNSWNVGKRNEPISKLGNRDYDWKYTSGIATCTWSRPYVTTVRGRTFNLLNSTYHILLAKGSMLSSGGVGYHTGGKLASANLVNFTSSDYIGGAGVDPAIKIHGTFMVTAWIGFVSLGILLARHFKSAWENKTLCGVKIWFALHRGFMIVALVFVFIAFIVIFVYKKGWDSVVNKQNPHAVLGCIAIALGLFQPIMAAFRPAPDDSKRPIFNWLHWAVGNAAQIFAVVTIFFAQDLGAANLKKDSLYWVMAVFVVVHCFFHFVFQLHAWSLEKKKNNEIKMLEMASGRTAGGLADNRQKTTSGNVFRVLLLGVYGIFLAVIILALYYLIGSA